jgi:hypothetical protein
MKPAIMRALLAATILLLCVSSVWAQSIPVPSINLSGTITSTNTFQSIQGKTNNRLGCTIQNPATNSNNQWVYFGTLTSATKSASVLLQPGQSVNCAVNTDNVLGDPVSITGTSGDAFFANFQ